MAHFVCKERGQLVLRRRGVDHAACDEDWSPRQRECRQVVPIQNLERNLECRLPQVVREALDQTPTELADEALHRIVSK